MVRSAKDWPWSSYRATVGFVKPETCLTVDWVLGNFGKQRKRATAKYREFVREGKSQPSPWQALKNQVYLGSEEFVLQAQGYIKEEQSLDDIPKPQKLAPPKPLSYFVTGYNRNEGMARAYLRGH